MRIYRGSNSKGRRKYRRLFARIWDNSPPAFQSGERVKITTDIYGVRYQNRSVTVISKGTGYGTYAVQSTGRKSPLLVDQSHLEKAA